MSSEYVLLTQDRCPGCKQVKRYLKSKLDSGEIEEVPIESELGKQLDEEFNPMYVPFCLRRDSDGKFHKCAEGTIDQLIDEALSK